MKMNHQKIDRICAKILAYSIIFFFMFSLVLACFGCATKTRSVELAGMYLSEAGTLAIGSVDVVAAPVGEETATIKYSEDTAWLSPATKTHTIKISLTGTNSVDTVEGIVESICMAFIATAEGVTTNDVRHAITR